MKAFFDRLSLSQQFTLISLIVLILGTLGLGFWVGEQIKNGVVVHAGATTALYLDSFVAPLLQELSDSDSLTQNTVQTLHNLLGNTALGQHVVSFKVWTPSGVLLYSTDLEDIGKSFPMTPRLAVGWSALRSARSMKKKTPTWGSSTRHCWRLTARSFCGAPTR